MITRVGLGLLPWVLVGCGEVKTAPETTDASVPDAAAGTTDGPQAGCVEPPLGLVAWWPGENTADDVVGTNEGTLQGATFGIGPVGRGFAFDGDTHLQVDHGGALYPVGSFAIEAWIVPQRHGDQTLISAYECGNRCDGRSMMVLSIGKLTADEPGDHRHLAFDVRDVEDRYQRIVDPRDVTVGVAMHVVAVRDVRDGRARLAIYVDGALAVEAPLLAAGRLEAVESEQDPLMVGASFDYDASGAAVPKHHFEGVIDEISLYGTPLGEADARRLHAAGAQGKCKP